MSKVSYPRNPPPPRFCRQSIGGPSTQEKNPPRFFRQLDEKPLQNRMTPLPSRPFELKRPMVPSKDASPMLQPFAAEYSYVRCMNGKWIPVEIAFASVRQPDVIHVFKIKFPDQLLFSMMDMKINKSLRYRKDRLANQTSTYMSPIAPRSITCVEPTEWLPRLRKFVVEHLAVPAKQLPVPILVRGPQQQLFFTTFCRTLVFVTDVTKIIPSPHPLYKVRDHNHSKLVDHGCAADEARTIACCCILP